MKITITVDCTPLEARQLAGLPDIQPMQERLMGEIEQRFREAASRVTPETVLQQWFAALPAGLEQMRLAMEKIMKGQTGT